MDISGYKKIRWQRRNFGYYPSTIAYRFQNQLCIWWKHQLWTDYLVKKMLDVVSSCHLFFVLSRISAKRYFFFSYCHTMCHYEWNLYFMHIFTNCVLQITFFHYCIYRIIVYWFYIIIQFISYKLHKVIKKTHNQTIPLSQIFYWH